MYEHPIYKDVIELLTKKDMTAREIAIELYNKKKIKDESRIYIQPRLTEMIYKGYIKKVDVGFDYKSGRRVTLYGLSDTFKKIV